jgi:maltose-binding protein MalE
MICLAAAAAIQAARLNVLIKMIPEQEKHFTEKMVRDFERANACTVTISRFNDNWELPEKLKSLTPPIDVVKVPMGMAQILAQAGLVAAIRDILPPDSLQVFLDQFLLLKLGQVDNVVYYVPRKFETRITAYRKSRVDNAVQDWQQMRGPIERALATAGSGLPEGYVLEPDPSEWDYFDIFVAGFYWANTWYGGRKSGRIAHRGKDYSGTAIDLIDRCFQFGASENDILNVNSPYYADVLAWESLYAAYGVYPQEMWTEEWDGTSIWNAFGSGRIFMSFLTQIDCFFLHGTGEYGMNGFVKNGTDLGFAVMPRAVSTDGRTPKSRATSTGGWLWGVGSRSRNTQLAVRFIEHVSSSKNQLAECNYFGLIPIRKDIMGMAEIRFTHPWKNSVYRVSVQQVLLNAQRILPYTSDFDRIEKAYIGKWRAVVEK